MKNVKLQLIDLTHLEIPHTRKESQVVKYFIQYIFLVNIIKYNLRRFLDHVTRSINVLKIYGFCASNKEAFKSELQS